MVTWSHPHSFHVAGVALTALGGLWWRTGFSADAVDAAALCVAGVALFIAQMLPFLNIMFCGEKTCMRLVHRYLHTYIRIDNFIHTTVFTSRTFSPPPLSFLPSPSQLLHAHTQSHTPHTQLITTQRTHTYSSTHNFLHTNPSPSLFSFLLSPCHLYLSLAVCWKKLTCGVIRSVYFAWEKHVPGNLAWETVPGNLESGS